MVETVQAECKEGGRKRYGTKSSSHMLSRLPFLMCSSCMFSHTATILLLLAMWGLFQVNRSPWIGIAGHNAEDTGLDSIPFYSNLAESSSHFIAFTVDIFSSRSLSGNLWRPIECQHQIRKRCHFPDRR